jgi:regulator of cell morphogenesis and NO signaling
MSVNATITAETPVNEAIRLVPSTTTVFHRYGIDSCCGGALAIGEAARRHGVDLDALLDELARHEAGDPVG